MHFVGVRTISLLAGLKTVCDPSIAAIALILIRLYIQGSIQSAISISKLEK